MYPSITLTFSARNLIDSSLSLLHASCHKVCINLTTLPTSFPLFSREQKDMLVLKVMKEKLETLAMM